MVFEFVKADINDDSMRMLTATSVDPDSVKIVETDTADLQHIKIVEADTAMKADTANVKQGSSSCVYEPGCD